MRISVYVATSANGLISNARNVPDWLSPDYGQGFYSICQRTKAVIMGKTTYNILAPNYLPLNNEGTTVVLTTDRHAKSDNPTVIFTQEDASAIVQMLEMKGHSELVIIGGAMVISQFIRAGLVTDLYFVLEPVLFGGGLPLLKDVEIEAKLELLELNKLNENTIQLHYKMRR